MRLIYLESQQGLRCIEPSSNGSQVFRWFSPLHFTWFISLESLCCTADSFTAHLPISLYAVARSFDPPLVYPFFHPMKSLAHLPSMRRKHTWNFESLGCHITCLVPTQNHHQTQETPRWLYDHQLVRLRRPWSLPGFLSHHKVDERRNYYHRRSSDDLRKPNKKWHGCQTWGLNTKKIKKMCIEIQSFTKECCIPKNPYFGWTDGLWKPLCPSFKCPSPKSKDPCCFGATFAETFKEVEPFQPTNPTNESQSKYQKNHPLSQPGPFTFQIFRWVTPGHDSAIHFDTCKGSYRGLDLLNPKSTTITTSTEGGGLAGLW